MVEKIYDGLNVFRNGLLLGETKGKEFVPSHALSHYLKPDNFKNTIDLTYKKDTVEKYLKGESFEVNANIGYALIIYDNMPLGFCKISNKNDKKIAKNHYPKGLRNL